jgi:hypothetical protein
MTGRVRPHRLPRPPSIARVAVAVLAAVVLLAGPAGTTSPASAASLPRWTGGIDLYRPGVFTTQKTWLWCTAADVQIMRNIVDRLSNHKKAAQRRYFAYMRAHDRYAIPVSEGVDPAGWTAGLRRYVDSRYRLVASSSFKAALRSAVRSLRLTNLPVGITVSHGGHAWVLTGFTATADPAVTSRFTVTSVRVTGPLWGLQSRSYGYDMHPDKKLTRQQFRSFFTPWHYAGVRMAWEGDWVSVQPIGGSAASASTGAAPAGAVTAGAASAGASPAVARPVATPVVTSPGVIATHPPRLVLAASAAAGDGAIPTARAAPPDETRRPPGVDVDAGLAILVLVVVVAGAAGLQARRIAARRRG